MSAFPMMTIDRNFQTEWGNGRLIGGPADGAIIGSPFQAVDDNLYHTAANPHSGVDFPTWLGFPVREQRGAFVHALGWDDNAGWWIRTEYPEGYRSFYCHLMQAPIGFSVGQLVPAGTVVGFVGSTGAMTTGPHLHWSLNTPDWRLVDPLLYVGPDGLNFGEQAEAPISIPVTVDPAVVDPWIDMQTINVGDGRLIIENEIVPALAKLHRLLGGDGNVVRN